MWIYFLEHSDWSAANYSKQIQTLALYNVSLNSEQHNFDDPQLLKDKDLLIYQDNRINFTNIFVNTN